MTDGRLVAVGSLLAVALVLAWPAGGLRARRRAVLGQRSGTAGPVSDRSRPLATGGPMSGRSRATTSGARSGRFSGGRWAGVTAWTVARPRRAVGSAAALAGCVAALAAGPVAAVVLATYAGVLVRGVLRGHTSRALRREHRHRVDGLGSLAADLRAGSVTPAFGLTGVSAAGTDLVGSGSVGADRIDRLVGAAVRLAERTGAPLADLLERIEADARAMDRGLATAAAQAAGARATAWLLAGLPLGGIALGYAIGVDPVDVLLHTPIGAACAVGAVLLQVAGLAWADRLAGTGSRAA